jgi:hypothetical protein
MPSSIHRQYFRSALSADNVYPILVVTVFLFQVRHSAAHVSLSHAPQLFRYFVIACSAFWLVWKAFKQRNAPHKLDPRPLDVAQIRREIGWSLCT